MTLRMLRIPGTFVCLQGLPGDGRRNTVQCCSFPDDDSDDDSDVYSDYQSFEQQEENDNPSDNDDLAASSTTSLLSSTSPAYAAMYAAFPHLRFLSQQQQEQQHQQQQEERTTSRITTTTPLPAPSSNSDTVLLHSSHADDDDDETILREWHEECVATARDERREWRQASLSLNTHCLLNNNSNNNNNNSDNDDDYTNTTTTTTLNNPPPVLAILGETDETPWWLTPDGDLAVFETSNNNQNNNNNNNNGTLNFQNVRTVGSLAPGSVVHAVALFTVDSHCPAHPMNAEAAPPLTTYFAHSSSGGDTDTQIYAPGRAGQIQILQLSSNNNSNNTPRYVVASVDGYPYLLPGCLEHYASSASHQQYWWWMVTCVEGAYVRSGLDLGTQHLTTLPLGTLVRVRQKVVNAMGLSRLHIQAVVSAAVDNNNNNNDNDDHYPHDEIVEGWCSEFLNPLSGQRGTVLQPLPLPVPAVYRTLRSDVPIRSNVEAASAILGCAQAPGTRLVVVARQFSQSSHGAACYYQLAGDGGWVAVQDVEFVSMDESFDPNRPGQYHLEALRRVRRQMEQQQQQQREDDSSADDVEEAAATLISPSASSSMDGGVEEPFSAEEPLMIDTSISSSSSSGSPSHHRQLPMASSTSSSPLYLSPSRRKTSSRRSKNHNHTNHPNNSSNKKEDSSCLICLSEERSATMVHGETGHVACCLCCARILKARGGTCSVAWVLLFRG